MTVNLPSQLFWLAVSLTRYETTGGDEEVAAAVVATGNIKSTINERLCESIQKECDFLCTSANSMLMKTSPSDLLQFDVKRLNDELKQYAPTLISILQAAVSRHRDDTIPIYKTDQHRQNVASCAAAILLKERHPKMSALHYITSLSLHHGGATRSTFDRLGTIGMCMTDRSVIYKMDEMCAQFDSQVKEWKLSIERFMGGLLPTLTSDFQIICDNIDLEITPHLSTIHHRKQSLYWVNLLAVKHRVQANDLPDDRPQKPIQEMKNSEFLPSLLDHAALRLQFITLTARITTKRLTCLFDFSKLAVSHIKHRHSGSMKQKSELVSCLFTRLVCNELVVRKEWQWKQVCNILH